MLTRRSLLIGSFVSNAVLLSACSRTGGSLISKAIAASPGQKSTSPVKASRGDQTLSPNAASIRAPSIKAENISGGDYWHSNEMFIDWIDNAGDSVTREFIDPVTGVVNLPVGKTWSAVLRETARVGSMGHVKLRPGTLRVWWSGTASTEVRVDVPNWTKVTRTGPQSIEIEIPDGPAQLGGQFRIVLENNGVNTLTMVEPHAVYVDDLPAFDSGEIFDPRHVASYPADIGCIRVPHTTFVHIFDGLDKPMDRDLTYDQVVRPATNHFWRHRNYQTAARLASRLGPNVALWINANVMMDPAGLAQMAQAIAATGFTGKLVLESGLEFWNFGYPYVLQRIKARELIGPKISVVDNGGEPSTKDSHIDACCYAEKSMQLWEAFAAHFPQDRLIRVLTGQTGWFDLLSPMFAYRRGEGPRCGEIFDAHSINAYAGWTETEEMYNAGAQDFTPAQWDAEMGKRLAELMASIDLYKQQANGLPWSKNPNYLMYEGWHHIAAYDTYKLPNASGSAGQGTLEFASAITGRVATGDFVYSQSVWNWADAPGSPFPYQGAYARVVDATHVTLHATAADAVANARPLMLINPVSDAPFTNRGRAKAIADSAMAWIHSSRGVAWTESWWTQLKARVNGYLCIFEPKQAAAGPEGLWSFYPSGTNLHDPPGLLLSWWQSVPGA